MSTKTKRPRLSMTSAAKIEAVKRVNDGASKASVARDIGVPESTLRGWCKRYQATHLSPPDSDKSTDAEPRSPATAGLDLSNKSNVAHSVPAPAVPTTPIDLTKRSERSPIRTQRERVPDPYTGATMSASSSLSGPGSSNTNLTKLARLNPGLSAPSAQSASCALRSVRSPKPAHNGHRYLNETKNRNSVPKSKNRSPTLGNPPPLYSPINDNSYYWLMQYYRQLGGALSLPDFSLRSFSHILSPLQAQADVIQPIEFRENATAPEERRAAQPAESPEVGTENKGLLLAKKRSASGRSQKRARNVLDSLLFYNHNPIAAEESKGDLEPGTIEALEHGDQFLAWLEASEFSDPTVTRLQVHALRAMLHNLRARRGLLDASQSK